MKRKCLLILLCMLVFHSISYAQGLSIVLNGQPVSFYPTTGTPYLDASGRVMMPLRVILEKIGATAEYDDRNQIVTVRFEKTELGIPIGKNYVVINGKTQLNDAPAVIQNGRTYLPVRTVLEALGYVLSWDNNTQTARISKLPETTSGKSTATISSESSPKTSEAVITENAAIRANAEGNSAINLFNGGMIASENDELYFVNFKNRNRIWRVNVKTGKANAVADPGAQINVRNGYVYYIGENDSVYRAQSDGSSNEKLFSEPCDFLKVTDNALYFRCIGSSRSFMKSDLNGKRPEAVSVANLGKTLSLENKILTYSTDNVVVKFNLDYKYFYTERPSGSSSVAFTNVRSCQYQNPNTLWKTESRGGVYENYKFQTAPAFTTDGMRIYASAGYGNHGIIQSIMDETKQSFLNSDWDNETTGFFDNTGFSGNGYARFYSPLYLVGDYIYGYKLISNDQSSSDGRFEWVRMKTDGSNLKYIENPDDFVEAL